MINSQNAVRTTVLRSGESIASTVEALSSKTAKTYYHMVPGARFCMPDGLEVRFLGGRFTTDDKEIMEELDKVANKSTSMIYTNKAVVDAVDAAIKKAADDASDTAGKDTK